MLGRLFAVLALAVSAPSPAAAADAGGAVLIRGARVFDGERALGARDVLVERGLIARVGRRIAAPEGVAVIDGRGRTLLPGLLDAHVHGFPGPAQDAPRFGVTTEFDMFSVPAPADFARERARRESVARTDSADLWSSGLGATPPGGHPTALIKMYGGPEFPTLADADDADAYMRRRVADGSDHIKVLQDDGARGWRPASIPAFSDARLAQVLAAARRTGKRVVVHVQQAKDARLVATHGADALAHVWMDRVGPDDLARLIVARRLAVIPTLSVMAGGGAPEEAARTVADPGFGPLLSPFQRMMMTMPNPKPRAEAFTNAMANTRALIAAGATVLAGTDAPNPGTGHGVTLHQELELLVRAGLTPAQALTAATAGPARFFGVRDRGRIAPGLRGDLLLVDGDPTADITATRRIAGVWKNGYPIDRTRIPAGFVPGPPPGKGALFEE